MDVNTKDYEIFASEYQTEFQEIAVLLNDAGIGAGKVTGDTLWLASADFIALQDMQTGVIKKGDGRIVWPVTDENRKLHGAAYPFYFQKGGIYKLRVRGLIDQTIPEGRTPLFYNRFLVVEVLDEKFQSDALAAIWHEYQQPVFLKDELLGSFQLDKKYSSFQGSIELHGSTLVVHMHVDIHNEKSWNEALCNLRTLYTQLEKQGDDFRSFAASQLTELANDWLQDENADEISEEDFAGRMALTSLSINADGDYSVYYSDDDMFYGHAITVSGNIGSDFESANICG